MTTDKTPWLKLSLTVVDDAGRHEVKPTEARGFKLLLGYRDTGTMLDAYPLSLAELEGLDEEDVRHASPRPQEVDWEGFDVARVEAVLSELEPRARTAAKLLTAFGLMVKPTDNSARAFVDAYLVEFSRSLGKQSASVADAAGEAWNPPLWLSADWQQMLVHAEKLGVHSTSLRMMHLFRTYRAP